MLDLQNFDYHVQRNDATGSDTTLDVHTRKGETTLKKMI